MFAPTLGAVQPDRHELGGKEVDEADIDPRLRVIHRKVAVRSSSGEPASVVITVQRGWVFMSMAPRFTGDAILDPQKVDEVMNTLAQAREDAKRMGTGPRASGGGRPA
jgi:hypothetical protein